MCAILCSRWGGPEDLTIGEAPRPELGAGADRFAPGDRVTGTVDHGAFAEEAVIEAGRAIAALAERRATGKVVLEMTTGGTT